MVEAIRGISVASNPSPMMVTLPKPNGPFRWNQMSGGAALVCEALQPFAHHFFTTRAWKLGERTPDGSSGWAEVAASSGVASDRFGRVHQVHGADVVTYKEGERGPSGSLPAA